VSPPPQGVPSAASSHFKELPMPIRALIAAVAVVLAAAGSVHAKSPVQITPDDSTTVALVNKTVGNEQWVLALNFSDETLTGNVFNLSGAPPTFFYCEAESDDDFDFVDPELLRGDTLTFECQVASGCTTLPCVTDWQPVGAPIDLPGEFFLP
jgi:hypothetical protein